jgi:hypothetical protein
LRHGRRRRAGCLGVDAIEFAAGARLLQDRDDLVAGHRAAGRLDVAGTPAADRAVLARLGEFRLDLGARLGHFGLRPGIRGGFLGEGDASSQHGSGEDEGAVHGSSFP